MQKQVAYVCMVFRKNHHMALVGLWHIKEELRKGFSKFSNKFPKHLNNKERRSYHPNHISNINYLEKHVFLRIFVHKHQGDKHGIKHMQANHRKHVEQANTLIHFEFDFSESDLKEIIQTHESKRVERQRLHKLSLF